MHLRTKTGRTPRLLMPASPEWRWLASGDESPWFPRLPPETGWRLE